jgi:hypothetical protein
VEKQSRFRPREASLAAVVPLGFLKEADNCQGIIPAKDLTPEGTLKCCHFGPKLWVDARSRAHTQRGQRKASGLEPWTLGTRSGNQQGWGDIMQKRNQKPCPWLHNSVSDRSKIIREEIPREWTSLRQNGETADHGLDLEPVL